jgi:hypothetical protein
LDRFAKGFKKFFGNWLILVKIEQKQAGRVEQIAEKEEERGNVMREVVKKIGCWRLPTPDGVMLNY